MKFTCDFGIRHSEPSINSFTNSDRKEYDRIGEVFQAHAKSLAGYTEVRQSLIGIGHLMSVWILGAVGGGLAGFMARSPP